MVCLGNFLPDVNWISVCCEIRTHESNQICWEDDSLEFLLSKAFHNFNHDFSP